MCSQLGSCPRTQAVSSSVSDLALPAEDGDKHFPPLQVPVSPYFTVLAEGLTREHVKNTERCGLRLTHPYILELSAESAMEEALPGASRQTTVLTAMTKRERSWAGGSRSATTCHPQTSTRRGLPEPENKAPGAGPDAERSAPSPALALCACARLALSQGLGQEIDNARLAADDFRVKYETELAMRQSVENDIHGLRKVTDDTSVTRLQLETEIEALKEELLFMKKNHEEEVKGLQNQIANSGLTVELDAPKPQDLCKIMADIRAQYDELAQKNREELDKYWSQQIEESTTVVTSQTAEIGAAEMTLTELRRTVQSLEIDLDSMRNLKASLENSLREVEACYAMQMEQLNGVLLHLESELAQTRAEGQRQPQEYEALLMNVKVKLEAEINTYRHLLEDGEDFSPGDALDSSDSRQTIHKTTALRLVDGKVVSETSDTKVLRH
ncbi:unnamed protein product [Rangifer tarandus platyrhynchus]|uniref:IF rod domain-containing protein n=1 Tax=Rangifer tarandus platyrhynchus TaxID=3082113 RepID=A0ABN8XZ55_RANTA|nr:unnamed protein product [Rangifer tarandus platyrhynchus]